ncbi:MAG: pterin dehydratase [Hydrogenophilales bacterium 16-64-46]|nr:MAG: pterin dehydratase [Hydrogenophilales bacterium 12-64-13]OYZ05243.1 MAG: pterin dehydratase [Hydrogenophilales bacterium 16-64-46]OZA37057.1 MAG: pterin dehydratase [Hydrogenophilales bacterium 17-64-34]HQT01285.1 4a-hydroxytetrahydrobiopterin dehydratase [Thiobacillus sp.]
MLETPPGWEARGKPPILFRRFTFAAYGETRAFLDALAALSEETGIHPQNINFGTTYANVTLEAADGVDLTEADAAFARRVDALVRSA